MAKIHMYTFEGEGYVFDKMKFRLLLKKIQKKHNLSLDQCYEKISDLTGAPYDYTFEVVKNWQNGRSTPRNMKAVEAAAQAMTKLYGGGEEIKPLDMLEKVTGGAKSSKAEGGDAMTETEEKGTVVHRRPSRVDYQVCWPDAHAAIRSVYLMISRYIDEFKRTLAFEKCYGKGAPDCPSRDDIEAAIYDGMLDIPKDTFEKLLSFSRGYLRDMNYFDEGYDLIWFRDEGDCAFQTFQSFIVERYGDEIEDMELEAMTAVMEADLEAGADFSEDWYQEMARNSNEYVPSDDELYDQEPDSAPAQDYFPDYKPEYVNYIADKTYELLADMLKDK